MYKKTMKQAPKLKPTPPEPPKSLYYVYAGVEIEDVCCAISSIGNFEVYKESTGSRCEDDGYCSTPERAIKSALDDSGIQLASLNHLQYDTWAKPLMEAGFVPVAGCRNGPRGNDVVLFARVGYEPKLDATRKLFE